MPIDLQNNHFDDLEQIHYPGAYAAVRQTLCEQDAYESGAVLECANVEQLAEVQCAHAQRTAALMARRRGERLSAQFYQLPEGLQGVLFQRFPRRGRQRCFVVTPDDVITLQPGRCMPSSSRLCGP